MEIKPTCVTFEQAKLFNDKGFDIPVRAMYHHDELIYGGVPYNHNNKEEQKLWSCVKVSAPEQWQVIEWLRINYRIWISISPSISNQFEYIIYSMDSIISSGKYSSNYNSPQEAYSAAFDYILHNII